MSRLCPGLLGYGTIISSQIQSVYLNIHWACNRNRQIVGAVNKSGHGPNFSCVMHIFTFAPSFLLLKLATTLWACQWVPLPMPPWALADTISTHSKHAFPLNTFIHVVLQAPPTQVHLSSIQSKRLLTRELGEDEVTKLSLQLHEQEIKALDPLSRVLNKFLCLACTCTCACTS